MNNSCPTPLFVAVIEQLNKDINASIKKLNYGGCGFFALHVGIRLTKLKIPFKINVWDSSEDISHKKSNCNNALNCKDYNYYELSANHFTVESCGVLFDGYNIYKINDKEVNTYPNKIRGEYNLGEMWSAVEFGYWNPDYKKSQNTELINIIDKHLNMTNLVI